MNLDSTFGFRLTAILLLLVTATCSGLVLGELAERNQILRDQRIESQYCGPAHTTVEHTTFPKGV